MNPIGIQQLFTFPFPFLQQELAHFGNIFRAQEQPPTTAIDAFRALLPVKVGGINAQRIKQPGPEVIQNPLARHFLYHSAEHIGGHAVIME